MATVYIINAESLLEFVERQGVINSAEAAARFNWHVSDARKRLDALARLGLIEKRGPRSQRGEGATVGRVCEYAAISEPNTSRNNSG